MRKYNPNGRLNKEEFNALQNTILIQPQKILAIDPEARHNISKIQQKYWKRKAIFMHAMRVPVEEISNEEDLAFFIFHHYGSGEFNVCFRDKYNLSPYYQPEKDCKDKECKIWRKRNGLKAGSRIEAKCKFHKKFWPAMKPRCRLTIWERAYYDDYYSRFKFRYDRRKYLMHRMWFWIGRRNARRKERIEYY